jgi:hypothetical protein
MQVFDGEPFVVKRRFVMRCCGCGLTHRLRFRIVRGRDIEITSWVDHRRTANARRGSKLRSRNFGRAA